MNDQLQDKLESSWNITRFIVEGNSPIDLNALSVHDRSQAYRFLLNYGYDMNVATARESLEEIFAESLRFIKQYFCHGHSQCPVYLKLPEEIERLNDVRDLLVWASQPRTSDRQAWSCAVLRVMHTIHHLDNTMRVEFFPEIKRQILNRVKEHVSQLDDGTFLLGHGPNAIHLYGVYYKEEKTRDSLIFKLLHKPKNVSEKIHDRLGVKFVTYNRLDVLRTIYYLYNNNVIMFANLIPGRSRNTLLNMEKCHTIFSRLFMLSQQEVTFNDELLQELNDQLEASAREDARNLTSGREAYNPSSSSDYQSMQFTAQQLVKLENPGFFKTRRMRVQLEKYHIGPDLEGLLQELEGPGAEKERQLLFPLEIQIIDKLNYQQSIEGTASHEAYKQRQQDLAFLRVLAGLVNLHPELNPHAHRNISLPGL
ncbi:TIGR04552 family protein [bacterium]|nr:TIGR04552 family protein [bacterium]